MKTAHKLEEELVSAGGDVLTKGLPYIKAIKLFDDVVSACFGRKLDPQYEELIKRFEGAYRDLGFDPTPKVFELLIKLSYYFKSKAHIVFEHITQFLNIFNSGEEEPVGMF